MQLQLERKLVEVLLQKKLVQQEKKLVEHRQISRASPFFMSLTSSASFLSSFICGDALVLESITPHGHTCKSLNSLGNSLL